MDAATFITACQQLQRLRFTESVAAAFGASVEEMNERYAMPLPRRHPERMFAAGNGRSRNRRGQWHELVQHLTDLAYLTPAKFARWHALRAGDELPDNQSLAAIAAAVADFLREDDYAEFRLLPVFPVGLTDRLSWIDRFLSPLVYRAALYTSFDGDLLPRPAYVIGEPSPFGRSLAFRMRVYFHDYYDRRSEARKRFFDAELLPLLYSLDNSLGDKYSRLLPERGATDLHPTLQRVLLDSQLLFDDFRRANRFTPDAGDPYYLVYTLAEASQGIPVSERLERRAERKLKRETYHEDTGGNRLGVRLLQMGLWRAGFYTGVLDGAFGPQSHAATLALLAQEAEAIRDKEAGSRVLGKRQLRRVLVATDTAGRNRYLIDLRLMGRLLDAYAPPAEDEARREEDAIWQRIRQADAEERLDAMLVEREQLLQQQYGTLHRQPARRVYYGLRGLIRGAFRAVGRILRWIARAVETMLGAVFDFVKATVKRIQEGAGLFFAGIEAFAHYLLGRPFVSLGRATDGLRPVLLTHYRIDFDVLTLIDPTVTSDDLTAHRDRLRRGQEGIAYVMEVVTSIVGMVGQLQPPLSWLRLGVIIARWVRDRLERSGRREAVA